MKSDGQVAQKLKQVKYRHFKKEAEALLSRKPRNCKNCKLLQTGQDSQLGVCVLDSEVCDSNLRDRSKGCESFDLRHSKSAIKDSLREFFETREVHEISVRFPDVAALLWVLEGEQEGDLLPGSSLVGEISGVEVWADSATQASHAWEHLQVLQADLQKALQKAAALGEELSSRDLELAQAKSQSHEKIEALQGVLDHYKKALSEKEVELEQAESQLEEARRVPAPALPWWKRLFR